MRAVWKIVVLLAVMALTTVSASGTEPSDSVACFDINAVKERLGNRNVESVEGVWRLLPEGAVIAVERNSLGNSEGSDDVSYRITAVDEADRSIRPGTVVGQMLPGGSRGVFEAKFFARDGSFMSMPYTVTVKIDEKQGRMEFYRHRTSIRVNLWHFVPFLWRYSVRYKPDDASYRKGAVRLYPRPAVPEKPIYL